MTPQEIIDTHSNGPVKSEWHKDEVVSMLEIALGYSEGNLAALKLSIEGRVKMQSELMDTSFSLIGNPERAYDNKVYQLIIDTCKDSNAYLNSLLKMIEG